MASLRSCIWHRVALRMFLWWSVSIVFAPIIAFASTFSIVYIAPGTPGISNPAAQYNAQGRDGNIYTTSEFAGTTAGGVFSISPTGSVALINDSIGGFVQSGVTLGTNGKFYGANQNQGIQNCADFNGCGQIYSVTPGGIENVLYDFTDGTDGADPQAAPVQAANGRFYGTTSYSSGGGPSTAYSLTASGAFTLVHTFTSAEGSSVVAGLIQGSDGNLYGVAQNGGANGYGSIFKMTLGGAVTVLHSFEGSDGSQPTKPLVEGTDGKFYGATTAGGDFAGVVFSITSNGAYKLLHTFTPGTDGNFPSSSLMQATDGKFYGATETAGPSGGGTIYSVTTGGHFAVEHSFDSSSIGGGFNPQSPLTQNTSGLIFGTTFQGGVCANSNGCGVVYSLDVGQGPFIAPVTIAAVEGSKIGILGQGFAASTSVSFNGAQATTVGRSGTSYLLATVPSGALSGPIMVKTGPARLMSNVAFNVIPTIRTFSPASGAVGSKVSLKGTGLLQTTKVTFNKLMANYHVNSDTTLTATVPAGATSGSIVIFTQGGSVASSGSFTVN